VNNQEHSKDFPLPGKNSALSIIEPKWQRRCPWGKRIPNSRERTRHIEKTGKQSKKTKLGIYRTGDWIAGGGKQGRVRYRAVHTPFWRLSFAVSAVRSKEQLRKKKGRETSCIPLTLARRKNRASKDFPVPRNDPFPQNRSVIKGPLVKRKEKECLSP